MTFMKTLIWILKRLFVLLISVIGTVFLASVISTNRIINSLNEIISDSSNLGERISMSFYDFIHFGSLYGIFVFLALTIAFAAAWGVYKIAGFGRKIAYIVAGSTAMFVMLWAMEQVFFGVPIVGGARDSLGLALQMLAGGIGGFIFATLTSPKPAKSI